MSPRLILGVSEYCYNLNYDLLFLLCLIKSLKSRSPWLLDVVSCSIGADINEIKKVDFNNPLLN